MRRSQKGFVPSEPLIVFGAFMIVCLVAGLGIGSVFRWSVPVGLALSAALVMAGVTAFWLYARQVQ